MTHQEELLSLKWKAKRERIISENGLMCRHCKNEEILARSREGIIESIRGLVRNTSESKSAAILEYEVQFRQFNEDNIHTEFLQSQNALSQEDFSSYKLFYEKVNERYVRIVINAINSLLRDGTVRWRYVRGLQLRQLYCQEGVVLWEYPDDAFITLCWVCHAKLHATEEIRHLDKDGADIGMLKPCERCHGTGYFPEYDHMEDGICFRCRGAKYEQLIDRFSGGRPIR